jgi:formylglycine-generating enzyme required for sulfatase activity/dienelactone hydrolase
LQIQTAPFPRNSLDIASSSSLAEALHGRYTLERELGRGGMATVYLVRDLKHDRSVALKVLRPELATTLGPERFQREIRFAARLQHPHILSVYDSGEAAGQLWFTMPFVEGESLRDRLRREPQLPLDDALRVAREAAEALGYAHEHGVIHRDVKPENIMLTRDGNTLVADFGIARAVGGDGTEQLTATGMSIGTPAYMSPEQAAGATHLDGRTDIYSLGCVLYEMLAGAAPFTGTTPQSVIAKRFVEPPPRVSALRNTVPPAVEAAVAKALSREPDDRFATATEFAQALAPPSTMSAVPGREAVRGRDRRATWMARALIVVVGVGVAIGLALVGVPGARHSLSAAAGKGKGVAWARDSAIPAIGLLADSGRWDSAYTLATTAGVILPHDSALAKLWPRFSDTITIRSEPVGARVYWKPYATPNAPGILLGTTPVAAARIPFRFSRLHIEKPGYRSLDVAIWLTLATRAPFALDSEIAPATGMVRVAGGETDVNLPGLDQLEPLKLGDYLIGRYEVTNKEFQHFVEAGGYQKRELWKHPFKVGARELSWSEAMARFTDKTGRPGPASWEGGSYAEGQGDYPVTGVSWYEAAAYAAFVGADLPTIYHWSRAAFTWGSSAIVPQSNFSGRGLARVGEYHGVGPFGTSDMAGNAREWCLNQAGTERYVLGGGWNDPTYAFNDAYAQDPFDRSATNGFRLAKYLTDDNLAVAERNIVRAFRDFNKERPVSDEVFAAYRRMYDYDRTKLNAKVDTTDEESDDWVRQRVSFDAAYNHERVAAYVYIPKHGKPPYQAVVFFPGSNAIHDRSSAKGITTFAFDFVIKSGRAVIHPIYKSTYERQDSLHSDYPDMSNFYKEHVIAWAKDMRRSIDYLDTRSDIDTARVAYYGVSWGGYLGGLMPAVEPRFKAVVLLVAGLEVQQGQPEVEPINFLPRIRIPVLMLNGQYDHYFPVETAQRPMFRLLGTPPDQKRQVISEGGHFVPRTQLVKETLDWLDRYLGPVQ